MNILSLFDGISCGQLALKKANIFYENYYDLEIPKNSIIYCDPPYFQTTEYSNKIDHEHFWEWVRKISKENKVFVSEYQAPLDFETIWEKSVLIELSKNKQYKNRKRENFCS